MENNNKEEFDWEKEVLPNTIERIKRERQRKIELDERLAHCRLVKIRQQGIAIGLAAVIAVVGGAIAYGRSHVTVKPEPKTPIVTEDDGKLQLTRKYTIQFGDTLTSLSHQSGIPISTIKDDNNIENANNIYMNQNIVLNYRIEPEDLDYYTQTVEMDGKSISQIASEYNTTINTLIEMNGEDIQNYNNGTIKVPNFISPEKLEELKSARQR